MKYPLLKVALFFILSSVVSISKLHAANGKHYVVLKKQDFGVQQSYKVSQDFPREFIKEKWKQRYDITSINYSGNTWFVVMSKIPGKNHKQHFMFNPGPTETREKHQDGYVITDSTHYGFGKNNTGYIIVFSKVKDSPTKGNWHIGYPYNELSTHVKRALSNKLKVIHAKSYKRGNTERYNVVARYKPSIERQNYAQRKSFPKDYIENQRKKGFEVESLTYSSIEKSWFVVMSKYTNRRPWLWVNYNNQQDLFKKYFKEKGYSIVGVY